MDKATGEPTGIVGTATFTPEAPDGLVEIEFVVPAGYAGKTLVAFEVVTKGDLEVASHTDIEDVEQTVTVEPTPTPEPPKQVPPAEGSAPLINSGGAEGGAANAGLLALGGVVVLGSAAGGVLVVNRRRAASGAASTGVCQDFCVSGGGVASRARLVGNGASPHERSRRWDAWRVGRAGCPGS